MRHPPVHRLVAAYLEYEAPAATTPEAQQQSLDSLLATMPIQHNAPALDTQGWDAFKNREELAHGEQR